MHQCYKCLLFGDGDICSCGTPYLINKDPYDLSTKYVYEKYSDECPYDPDLNCYDFECEGC